MTRLAWRLLGGAREGTTEGLVVSPDCKRPALEEVAEMLDGQKNSQKLAVKGRVLDLSRRKQPEEEELAGMTLTGFL